MKAGATAIAWASLVAGLCLLMAQEYVLLPAHAGGQGVTGHIGRAVSDQRSINQGSRVSLPVVRQALDCRDTGEGRILQGQQLEEASIGVSSLDKTRERYPAQLGQTGHRGNSDALGVASLRGPDHDAEPSRTACP